MPDPAEYTVEILQQVTKLFQELTPSQVRELVEGSARIAFISGETVLIASTAGPSRRPGATRVPTATLPTAHEAANHIQNLSTPSERRDYLTNSGLLKEALKDVARLLKVKLSGTKEELIERLATETKRRVAENVHEASTDLKMSKPETPRTGFERLMGGPWRQ